MTGRFVCTSIMIGAALLMSALPGCDTPTIDLGQPPVRVAEDKAGSGPAAKPGDLVTIAYEILLPDGTRVLSDEEYRFELGAGTVISGIDEAVEGMRLGGRRVVDCPPHRHWGRSGYGDGLIPPNTNLTIDITLLRVGFDDDRRTVRR